MIIVSNLEESAARPGTLTARFNCKAAESAQVDLSVDDIYVYMLPGDEISVDVPKDWGLKEGDTVPLSRFALLDCQQGNKTRTAWTREELPTLSGLQP